jgi:hypothetical protein
MLVIKEDDGACGFDDSSRAARVWGRSIQWKARPMRAALNWPMVGERVWELPSWMRMLGVFRV